MNVLTISSWSVFEEAKFEAGPFNVIIGPQSSGKSLVMKLFYFFNNFPSFAFQQLRQKSSFDDLMKHNRQRFSHYFPPSTWGDKRFSISFESDIGVFRIKRHPKSSEDIIIYYPSHIKELYEATRNKQQPGVDSEFQLLVTDHASVLSRTEKELKFWRSINIYIPASRAFFANIQANAFRFLAEGDRLDPFIVDFGQRYEQILNTNSRRSRSLMNGEELVELLGGSLQRKDNLIELSSTGNRKILISCSSSGQQEMAPLLIILSHYLNGHLDGFPRNYNRQRTINIYIEEPEAHLFPSSQKKIVEIIASTFKSILKSVPSSRFFVTTHSPYVLTTLNNLILASSLKNKGIKLKYSDKSIKKNQIKSYKIHDGQIFSIQELKTGLIDANYIDSISSQIIEEFEEILNA